VITTQRPRFLLDLEEELLWLKGNAGVAVAERWYSAVVLTIQFIEQHPFTGRERNDLFPAGIRSWRVRDFPRWLIFYSAPSPNKIVLYRIRSGTMNLVVMKMTS
jgi:plasmid stabilization system protein ParE